MKANKNMPEWTEKYCKTPADHDHMEAILEVLDECGPRAFGSALVNMGYSDFLEKRENRRANILKTKRNKEKRRKKKR